MSLLPILNKLEQFLQPAFELKVHNDLERFIIFAYNHLRFIAADIANDTDPSLSTSESSEVRSTIVGL